MAKVQTRRNVSVTAPTYEKLKAYCELNNVSMSGVVEARVNEYLDAQPEDLLAEATGVVAAPCGAPDEVGSVAREMYQRAVPEAERRAYRIARRRGGEP